MKGSCMSFMQLWSIPEEWEAVITLLMPSTRLIKEMNGSTSVIATGNKPPRLML